MRPAGPPPSQASQLPQGFVGWYESAWLLGRQRQAPVPAISSDRRLRLIHGEPAAWPLICASMRCASSSSCAQRCAECRCRALLIRAFAFVPHRWRAWLKHLSQRGALAVSERAGVAPTRDSSRCQLAHRIGPAGFHPFADAGLRACAGHWFGLAKVEDGVHQRRTHQSASLSKPLRLARFRR